MKEKPNWDGSTPVYSAEGGEWFDSYDAIVDYYHKWVDEIDEDAEPDDDYLEMLQLYLSRPPFIPRIERPALDSAFDDETCEDISEIILAANQQIEALLKDTLWPSTTRAIYGASDEGGES